MKRVSKVRGVGIFFLGWMLPSCQVQLTRHGSLEEDAQAFLAFYNPTYQNLYKESGKAAWLASTDVSEEHTGMRTGADLAMASFVGSTFVIERAQALLAASNTQPSVSDRLNPLTQKQLEKILYNAAFAPQTHPELARKRVELEAKQSALLDGYVFCLEQNPDGTCKIKTTANEIDQILMRELDPQKRTQAWRAAKSIGAGLKPGLVELVQLRNQVAQAMGYSDYFAYQVSDYGMTTDEMMQTLDRLIAETRPLYTRLQCFTKRKLAERYKQPIPSGNIPAPWLTNRWGQNWGNIVDGVNMDNLLKDKEPKWIVEQAERFYVSMGFERLPQNFWDGSDLYPAPEGREKNSHASAWHIDLDHEVRSLMSVEPTWEWFTTTHHELGHIYYYLSYSREGVPLLLREGANRGFHEGIGDLIALASSQTPYVQGIGLMSPAQTPNEMDVLLDSALTGPIVFMPFAAGVMSHFERDLYAGNLDPKEWNNRWWQYAATYQGMEPGAPRSETDCDACTKTHINDDPAQYYDYALANVLVFQLHDHICKNILRQSPRACNYYGHKEVGDFLKGILSLGATQDWRLVLREHLGRELSATPMLEYYAPLMEYLDQHNGNSCE